MKTSVVRTRSTVLWSQVKELNWRPRPKKTQLWRDPLANIAHYSYLIRNLKKKKNLCTSTPKYEKGSEGDRQGRGKKKEKQPVTCETLCALSSVWSQEARCSFQRGGGTHVLLICEAGRVGFRAAETSVYSVRKAKRNKRRCQSDTHEERDRRQEGSWAHAYWLAC